jgi:prepilin-type N-terminal cleavage/methylation domain-containing protein
MKKHRYGFTFAELMMSLLIIAVLASILIPVIVNKKPNRSKVMFRKAYYVVERVVSELINDDELYPDESTNGEGFLNSYIYSTNASGDTTSTENVAKFCINFAERVNINGSVNCGATDFASPTFVTNDGVSWIVPATKFSKTDPTVISVDVNNEQEPNCYYDATSCQKPDRFKINVYYDGRIKLDDEKGIEYLKSNTVL